MIFGECPNCDAPTMSKCADECPTFQRIVCEACGKPYWLLHSRLDPESYTQEQFDERWVIGDDRVIRRRKQESAS